MLRNVLALVAGVVVGGVVNTGLVFVGPLVIPPPAGVDVTSAEGLRAGLTQLQPRHFLFPFLAHAIGTLAGAAVAARLATPPRGRTLALVVGAVFFAGGVMAATMIPAPGWFVAVDLLGAYLPMAWLGGRGAGRRA